MNRAIGLSKALLATLTLLALLIGIPYALYTLAPLTVPQTLPTATQIINTLTSPDDGSAIVITIAIIGWLAWATFAASTIMETLAAISSWQPPRLRLIAPQRALARQLITTIVIGFTILSATTTATATAATSTVPEATQPVAIAAALHTMGDTPTITKTSTDTDTTSAAVVHTVQAGESLWEIAQNTLGNGDDWQQIYQANHLTSTTIHPGQKLTIPTIEADNKTQQETEADAPPAPAPAQTNDTETETDSFAKQAGQTDLEKTSTSKLAATTISDDVDEDSAISPAGEEESSNMAMTTGGVGAALALSLISLLALRRRRGQHDRPLGSRLTTPDPQDSLLEAQLQQVADPVEMSTVDRALRKLGQDLAQVPNIRAARMRPDALELYLHDPATLPSPWYGSADQLVWTIDSPDLPTTDIDAPAPYPALVTLGIDAEEAQVLIDLEHVQSLGIEGPHEQAISAMASIATELSLSPWADDLQITLVGIFPELADALDTGRIRYINNLDEITAQLSARTPKTNSDDIWAPEILLVPDTLTTSQAQQIDDIITQTPRIGVAMVSENHTSGNWSLTLENQQQALLQPAGLTLTPQTLTPNDYATILTLLGNATTYTPGPDWTSTLNQLEHPTLTQAAQAAANPQPLDDVETDITPRPKTQLHDINILLPEPANDDVETDNNTLAPRLRILGQVTLDDAQGTKPASSHIQKSLEIITYLALHPEGVNHTQLDSTIWAGKEVKNTSRNAQISRARRWLGANTHGQNYLPSVAPMPTGGEGWHLDDVETDWDEFQTLIGPNPIETPINNLNRALNLITAEPLTGTRRTHFTWADPIRQNINSTITDVAHILATRAITNGHPIIAQNAANQALLATKDEERTWRDLLTATSLLGQNPQPLITQMQNHFNELDIELEDETLDLIEQITQPHPIAINA